MREISSCSCLVLLSKTNKPLFSPPYNNTISIFRPFPTYETATTRYFFHGRTETVRSCTREALELARAVTAELDGAGGGGDLRSLLDAAVARHDQLMDLCKRGLGCDRHLLGIAVAASEDEEDSSLPEIFTDPAFVKR